jgi:hypothetical protein
MTSATMTAEELWQTLLDETGDALIEEAAAVSLAQAERELAAAGIGVAEVHARADTFLASLRTGADGGPGEPVVATAVEQEAPSRPALASRKKARPVPAWVAAAAATVAAGAAVAYVATRPSEGTPPVPTTPPSTAAPPPPARVDLVAQATELRRGAAAACNEGHPEECLALLDDAREKDPAGDTREDVRALRQRAEAQRREQELEAKPKPR